LRNLIAKENDNCVAEVARLQVGFGKSEFLRIRLQQKMG
jgi:hypothetical protein